MQQRDLLMRAMAEHPNEVHPPSDSSRLREFAEELQRQADMRGQMVTSEETAVHAE